MEVLHRVGALRPVERTGSLVVLVDLEDSADDVAQVTASILPVGLLQVRDDRVPGIVVAEEPTLHDLVEKRLMSLIR